MADIKTSHSLTRPHDLILLLLSRLTQLEGHLCLYYTLESAATVNRNETNLLYYHLGLLNNTRTHISRADVVPQER